MEDFPGKIDAAGLELHIRVTPKSSANRIDGIALDANGRPHLKLRVTDPPENGKANSGVLKLLARQLGVAKSAVTLLSGDTAREKKISVAGDGRALAERLKELLSRAGK